MPSKTGPERPKSIPAGDGESIGRPITGSKSEGETSERLNRMLLQLWHSNQATIDDRLTCLRLAREAMLDGPSSSAGRDSARIAGRDAAHKLAGVLGSFGLPRGSDLALQAEALLDRPVGSESSARAFTILIDELTALIAAKTQQAQ